MIDRRGGAVGILLVGALTALPLGPWRLAAQAAQPTARRAMTVDDFLGIRMAGDPRVSPTGELVAFTVTVAALDSNRNVTRIWMHSLVDGSTRELTRGPGSDQSPRWARDGRTLTFLSTRGGSPQVWRIRTDGGEPVRLTSIPTGVNRFFLTPDTTALFAATDVTWPADQELDRRQAEYPTSARLWDGLFYRHWTEWRAGLRQHLFRVTIPGGIATDITPIDQDVPTLALGGDDVAVSPFGTELAIVFNPDSNDATSTNNDVFLVGPDGTALVPMTDGRGNDHSPSYSPNARWLAYLSMATPGFESDRQQVMLYDRATGDRRSLTSDWDVSVRGITWMPDSRSLILEVEERGEQNLYRVLVPEAERTLLVKGGVNSSPQPTPAGDQIVFLRQSARQPPELYSLRLEEGRPPIVGRLTSLNAGLLASLELQPLEPFRFAGAAGDSVSGWIMKPPGFDPARTYPVAYLIHGGPQGAWLDSWHPRWNYAMFAARGYVVAAVNFHGSTGYGQAFTNSISRHWGDLPYDDLMKGLDYVAALPYVDPARIGAAGASYGGYMIYWLAGQTDRFRALVAHDGIYNTESMFGTTEELWFPIHEFGGRPTEASTRALLAKWSPSTHSDQWRTPMLIVHGQQDFRVDVSEGLQAYTALKLRGVDGRFLYFPDEGHFVLKPRNRRLWWGVVLDWLDRYLRPTQS